MAYETFIPTVWNSSLNRELERLHVLAKHTNREYEGDVKEQGDSVRILNVGKPTITSLLVSTGKSTLQGNISAAEEIENTSITMPINQIKYYNYKIGDIDKAQVKNDGKLMAAYQKETAEGLADAMDVYLGQTVFPTAPLFTNTYSNATYNYIKVHAGASASAAADAFQNVLELLDDLLEQAHLNDIPDTTKLYLNCSPKFWKVAKRAFIAVSTNNVKELNGREYITYNNIDIEWSNNVKSVAAVNGQNAFYDYVTLRTERSIAFINALAHTEAYRPELGFADAIKGFILFDAMVVRPKEILQVKVTY